MSDQKPEVLGYANPLTPRHVRRSTVDEDPYGLTPPRDWKRSIKIVLVVLFSLFWIAFWRAMYTSPF